MLQEQDRRSKRQKSNGNRNNECVICGKRPFRKDSKLYRLCETERAELFLRVTKFNLDVALTKVSIIDEPDDLFAADIMSHKLCMNREFYIFKIAKCNLLLQLVNCLDSQQIQFQWLEIKFHVLKFKKANNNC